MVTAVHDFTVDPAELLEFAKHVDGLAADIGETRQKLTGAPPAPQQFGLIGQLLFGFPVLAEWVKVMDAFNRYRDALKLLEEKVKDTARGYADIDAQNADNLGKQI